MPMSLEQGKHKGAITVRQPNLTFGRDIPKHWFSGNPTITHNFNSYNLLFPTFERFFIRSVVHFENQIEDEDLLRQIKGFMGQESMHAKVHESYFKLLEQQGYEIRGHLKRFARYSDLIEKLASPQLCLAMTAAAEHYTATLAGIILNTPGLVDGMAPSMRKLIVWHAVEEIEHRSVSFEVMQHAGVSYLTRILAFVMVTLDSLLWVTLGSFLFMRKDRVSLFRSLLFKHRFRRAFPTVHKQFRHSLLAYFRPGYHPDQIEVPESYRSQLDAVGVHATG